MGYSDNQLGATAGTPAAKIAGRVISMIPVPGFSLIGGLISLFGSLFGPPIKTPTYSLMLLMPDKKIPTVASILLHPLWGGQKLGDFITEETEGLYVRGSGLPAAMMGVINNFPKIQSLHNGVMIPFRSKLQSLPDASQQRILNAILAMPNAVRDKIITSRGRKFHNDRYFLSDHKGNMTNALNNGYQWVIDSFNDVFKQVTGQSVSNVVLTVPKPVKKKKAA